ncbi:uncharacterized protein LOC141611722 [Silene latifolia]|uniref:uncharacterized protein LOC141611722 n=1 Tax=Silene latifolia TaxID=37657 RepID=UPI003D7847BD
MSTSINTSPTGDKVVALTEWVTRNKELLLELQTKIRNVRDPNAPIRISTLNALKSKKHTRDTLQDERYRVTVTVPSPLLQKINAYLGCSHGGKRSEYAAGESFKCENCTKDGVVSEPRITFNCEVFDGTEQLEITAFTEDTDKNFCVSALDISHIKHSEDCLAFEGIQAMLKNEPFTIEVSPKTDLSRNNILQWGLRDVIPIPEQLAISPSFPQAIFAKEATTINVAVQPPPVARQLDFRCPIKDPASVVFYTCSSQAKYCTSQPASSPCYKLPAVILSFFHHP